MKLWVQGELRQCVQREHKQCVQGEPRLCVQQEPRLCVQKEHRQCIPWGHVFIELAKEGCYGLTVGVLSKFMLNLTFSVLVLGGTFEKWPDHNDEIRVLIKGSREPISLFCYFTNKGRWNRCHIWSRVSASRIGIYHELGFHSH